eukprot:Skav215346  [mRNA]  locus=scaffold1391:391509:392846:+ [translate_table: standard]
MSAKPTFSINKRIMDQNSAPTLATHVVTKSRSCRNRETVLTIRKVRTTRISLMTRTLLALCSWPPSIKIAGRTRSSRP